MKEGVVERVVSRENVKGWEREDVTCDGNKLKAEDLLENDMI